MIEALTVIINNKTAKLAVIGLGYVGLPVACAFAQAGFDTLGIDILPERVDQINSGVSPIEGDEPGLSQLLSAAVESGRLRAFSDYANLADRDVILIDVETPVDEDHIPQYHALRAALQELGPVLQTGALVIVESTIAPGTIAGLVKPLLEESSGKCVNTDFFLGNCPERVMPGKLLANLTNLSRVVGGGTPQTAAAMCALYRHIVQADLDPADWITAELVKTVENAYRDVQIAFANEVALICEPLGGDVWRVRELVNKSPQRHMHLPGGGVGGHCIPKDPWLLAYSVQDKVVPLRLIPAARAVNDGMPGHVADILVKALAEHGIEPSNARVLVLGYAYLEDSDDTRNSPSAVLIDELKALEMVVRVHDPFVAEYSGDLYNIAEGCQALVLMVKHAAYRHLNFPMLASVMQTPIMLDMRNLFNPVDVTSANFDYYCLGTGYIN